MSLEKVLHKMQSQINEIAPTLELFIDETIQPSVDNCEKLQQQLTLLQENLAVYKYNKNNKEISPSFRIHAKVSATEPVQSIVKKQGPKIPEVEKETFIPAKPLIDTSEEIISSVPKTLPVFTIGINDKFRFINELFKLNNSEYGIAMEQLSVLKNLGETEIYLNSLKTLYSWSETNETVIYFFSIAKKRFN
ncbi:MAG: hypothetical protein WCH21_06495 [Bacteroidota bacterium]